MDVQDDVARRRSRAARTGIDPARVAARCRGQRGYSARPSARYLKGQAALAPDAGVIPASEIQSGEVRRLARRMPCPKVVAQWMPGEWRYRITAGARRGQTEHENLALVGLSHPAKKGVLDESTDPPSGS
jgi:hypothetical protein